MFSGSIKGRPNQASVPQLGQSSDSMKVLFALAALVAVACAIPTYNPAQQTHGKRSATVTRDKSAILASSLCYPTSILYTETNAANALLPMLPLQWAWTRMSP